MSLRQVFLSTAAVLSLSTASAQAQGGPIMPLSQVKPGMDCTGETVIQGTTISTFGVHVIDIVQDPAEGARILISVSGPAVAATGIAEGFSGSPVLCDDGSGTVRNIGAISEGIGQYGNNVALVTPIEQMLGEPVAPPVGAPRLSVRTHPLLGPLSFGGLSPGMLSVLQRAGRKAGRTIISAPSGSATSFPVQQLVPGASVATQYGDGAIPVGAIGTVTYRDGQTIYAFGHPLDGAGRRSLILEDAYVYYVVNNPGASGGTSYKLASPGHIVGTLSSDTPNAVIGTVGTPPPMVPVDVTARDLDTGRVLSLRTLAADETDVGMPLGSSISALIGPLEVGQAATQIYDGAPANESGRMCLSVSVREMRGPLRFCNRYVSTGFPGDGTEVPPALALSTSADAGTALSLIDSVQFARLHVTHVSAQIDARRGLDESEIVSAHAPPRVHAGSRVRVRLAVQQYRGSVRTIGFPIRIPSDVHGRVVVRIGSAESPGASAADALAAVLGAALTGMSSGPPPPATPAALRKAFGAVGVYDGLELKIKGHKARHIYRDPAQLITGSAKLVFRVG